jgi:hypothetical protein
MFDLCSKADILRGLSAAYVCLPADQRPADSDITLLAAAVQQHPVSSLRAIEAGLRARQNWKQQQIPPEDLLVYNPIGCTAEEMPSSAWLVSSISSPVFWSGGESAAAAAAGASRGQSSIETDEVIVQVAALLQTCLKVSGIKSGNSPAGWLERTDLDQHQVQTQHHHHCISFALTVLKRLQEASIQLAALRSSSSSSSSSRSSSSSSSV